MEDGSVSRFVFFSISLALFIRRWIHLGIQERFYRMRYVPPFFLSRRSSDFWNPFFPGVVTPKCPFKASRLPTTAVKKKRKTKQKRFIFKALSNRSKRPHPHGSFWG